MKNMLSGKIHRATITESQLNYNGSITIDKKLMDMAGIAQYERVQIVNVNNGSRLETYALHGEEGSGVICLNGAAARWGQVGDPVIIMAYVLLDEEKCVNYQPRIVVVGENNCGVLME